MFIYLYFAGKPILIYSPTDRDRETLINSQKPGTGQQSGAVDPGSGGTGGAGVDTQSGAAYAAAGEATDLGEPLGGEEEFGYHNGNGSVEY